MLVKPNMWWWRSFAVDASDHRDLAESRDG